MGVGCFGIMKVLVVACSRNVCEITQGGTLETTLRRRAVIRFDTRSSEQLRVSDMRGSALYLHDEGGPHVPLHPRNKFGAHWKALHRREAMALIESAADGAFDKAALVKELDELLLA